MCRAALIAALDIIEITALMCTVSQCTAQSHVRKLSLARAAAASVLPTSILSPRGHADVEAQLSGNPEIITIYCKLHILAIRHLTLEQFMGHALQHLRLPDHHESRCVAWLQGSAFHAEPSHPQPAENAPNFLGYSCTQRVRIV